MTAGGASLGTQTVIVAGEGDGGPQEVLIVIHALDEGGQEQQELGVLAGGVAGLEAGSCRYRWRGTSCRACRSR